jgi:hypothetical protein
MVQDGKNGQTLILINVTFGRFCRFKKQILCPIYESLDDWTTMMEELKRVPPLILNRIFAPHV